MTHSTSRRKFLGTTGLALVAAPALMSQARAETADASDDTFAYEVTRTDAEWRARLTEGQHFILRENGTERRFSSSYWDKEDAGTYACRGCDLTIYESKWKTVRPIGWVFFYHAQPDAVLIGIDEWPAVMSGSDGIGESTFVTEAHCRRCGSHLGHILQVEDDMLHCINGMALEFKPAA